MPYTTGAETREAESGIRKQARGDQPGLGFTPVTISSFGHSCLFRVNSPLFNDLSSGRKKGIRFNIYGKKKKNKTLRVEKIPWIKN